MNLYNYILATAIIFTFLHKSVTDPNTELVYPECGLTAPSQTSIGLVFFIKVNNTSKRNDYDVEITPDECCLEEDDIDCDSIQIIAGCTDFVPRGAMKTINLIAPLLNQYERKGFCTVFVDSKSNNGDDKRRKRDVIKVNFDTTLKGTFDSLENYMHCEHKDEDPFNECKPVKCDIYYNGKKPYFSRKVKRCVEVPPCFKEDDYDYPSVIYNPQTNQCLEESIVNEDIEYIKTSFKDNSKKVKPKDIIMNKYHHATTFTNNSMLIDDIGKASTPQQEETMFTSVDDVNWNPTMKSYKEVNGLKPFLKKYFIDNKWALIVLVLVIIVQCILIFTMLYCLSKTCCCCEEKKVIRKFFNYRQDESVTTPLINTSNVESEAVEYDYLTDSSNRIDRKMKCYKACQKDINNAKKSMSDDILSKLLNRRNWKKNPSQANPDLGNSFKKTMAVTPINNQIDNSPKVEKRAPSETKVVFEDEKTNDIVYKKQSELDNMVDDANILDGFKERNETNLSSEKEIKSHSYSHFDTKTPGCRDTLALNNNVIKDGKFEKGTTPNSIEKGAQVYFSNDSIDDFLSERGIICLAGENISKYTFSNGSNDMNPSLRSSGSNKTSKHFLKKILSLVQKQSKQDTCSDPGQNKSIDVELIHMSRASVYSSTNDSDCITN